MKKKGIFWVSAVACVLVAATPVVACSPQTSDSSGGGSSSVEDSSEESAKLPAVYKLADGTIFQRTPDKTYERVFDTPLGTPVAEESDVDYNLDVLDADNRGCGACHSDLLELVSSMEPHHSGMAGGTWLDTNITVNACLDCHRPDAFTHNFSRLIHSLHGVDSDDQKATCFQCHDTDEHTNELTLWDNSKYDILNGIDDVPEVQGDFSWNQDEITDVSQMFSETWLTYEPESLGNEVGVEGDGTETDRSDTNTSKLADAVFNNWTITLGGMCDQELSWTLPELIEEAKADGAIKTSVMKYHCMINPLGGYMIGQFQVTGVSLKWLMDKVNIDEGATYVQMSVPDDDTGVEEGYEGVHMMLSEPLVSDITDDNDLLVFEVNGQRLPWSAGFPVSYWRAGSDASVFAKQVRGVTFTDTQIRYAGSSDTPFYIGRTFDGVAANIGNMNTHEGLVIPAGEPYTFEGYADGWYDQVTAVEFSMDQGATWTRFDVPDSDVNRWVRWSFTWTPPADTDAAYVLQMRTVTNGEAYGEQTGTPIQVMVNATTDYQSKLDRAVPAPSNVDADAKED